MNELEFAEYVTAFCKRPRMYMPVGTLGHVIAFLEGYSMAAGVQPYSHSRLSGFHEWLQQKMNRKRQMPNLWEDLLDCSSTDETELNNFARLYQEYAEMVCSKGGLSVTRKRILEAQD